MLYDLSFDDDGALGNDSATMRKSVLSSIERVHQDTGGIFTRKGFDLNKMNTVRPVLSVGLGRTALGLREWFGFR